MHEVLVNHLGGLSLPRKSVVRLTDRPDMTIDVYRGPKTTIQQQIVITSSRSAQKSADRVFSSLTVPCYSLGKYTFLIFVRIASPRRF